MIRDDVMDVRQKTKTAGPIIPHFLGKGEYLCRKSGKKVSICN
jgi:hypothetical protein